jgi:hypothetical protein
MYQSVTGEVQEKRLLGIRRYRWENNINTCIVTLLLLLLLLLLCPGSLIRHVVEIMTNVDKPWQTHILKPGLLNMQPAELCDVAHSHFDIYEALSHFYFTVYY